MSILDVSGKPSPGEVLSFQTLPTGSAGDMRLPPSLHPKGKFALCPEVTEWLFATERNSLFLFTLIYPSALARSLHGVPWESRSLAVPDSNGLFLSERSPVRAEGRVGWECPRYNASREPGKGCLKGMQGENRKHSVNGVLSGRGWGRVGLLYWGAQRTPQGWFQKLWSVSRGCTALRKTLGF